jgi:hypothetical protein
MDPVSLAAVAIGLLVPYLQRIAGKLGDRSGDAIADAAAPILKSLHQLVRTKLPPGSSQGALLDGVLEQPDDANRHQSLETALAGAAAQDEAFKADLERLVAAARAAGAVQITATDAGVVAAGDVKVRGTYVSGRDMTIGSPPREQQPPPEQQ